MIKSTLHHHVRVGTDAVHLFCNGDMHFYAIHLVLGAGEQEYLNKWISQEVEFTAQDVGS